MMDKTGRRTVPQIYIGDTHVGGYDELVALDRAGELDPLLRRQGPRRRRSRAFAPDSRCVKSGAGCDCQYGYNPISRSKDTRAWLTTRTSAPHRREATAPRQRAGSGFAIERIYVKDLSLENPGAPQSFQLTEHPQVEIGLRTRGGRSRRTSTNAC